MWVLIIAMIGLGGPNVETGSFVSESACVEAKQSIEQFYKGTNKELGIVQATCIYDDPEEYGNYVPEKD